MRWLQFSLVALDFLPLAHSLLFALSGSCVEVFFRVVLLIFIKILLLSLTLFLGSSLILVLLLALQVVLRKIAVLAEADRIVRLVRVAARGRHLGLALAMVAIVAHVLGVMLLVQVRTKEHVFLVEDVGVTELLQHGLLLEEADCVLGILLSRCRSLRERKLGGLVRVVLLLQLALVGGLQFLHFSLEL